MITNAKDFGQALRQRRKQLGYTQAFLSEVSGFSVTFISDLENGKHNPSLRLAMDIAKVFGKTVEDVFEFSEEYRDV